MQLSNQCQREILNMLNGYPVLVFILGSDVLHFGRPVWIRVRVWVHPLGGIGCILLFHFVNGVDVLFHKMETKNIYLCNQCPCMAWRAAFPLIFAAAHARVCRLREGGLRRARRFRHTHPHFQPFSAPILKMHFPEFYQLHFFTVFFGG